MNWKSILAMSIVIAVLVVTHYFYGEHRYKQGASDTVDSVTQDSVAVDTVIVATIDTVFITSYYLIEAKVDTVGEVLFYSANLDTTILVEKIRKMGGWTIYEEDTLAIIKEEITFSEGIFEVLRDIELRPIEVIRTITESIYQTVPVEVPADPPFYNTWIAGFISGVISFLILVISLT